MLDKTKEALLTRDLVSPTLCKQLAELGMRASAIAYTWRLFPDGWRIWTYQFDPCGLYKETDRALYMQFPQAKPKEVIPAYTIGDMAQVIPGFLLSSACDDFELSLDETYGNIYVRDDRIPDVFARAVIQLIGLRGYGIDYINKKFFS